MLKETKTGITVRIVNPEATPAAEKLNLFYRCFCYK